jgi:hypothetical protein
MTENWFAKLNFERFSIAIPLGYTDCSPAIRIAYPTN